MKAAALYFHLSSPSAKSEKAISPSLLSHTDGVREGHPPIFPPEAPIRTIYIKEESIRPISLRNTCCKERFHYFM